jgi:GTP pyrophosphokinase
MRVLELKPLTDRIVHYHPKADILPVERAFQFASRAHDGQRRRSGDPYVIHPLSVASIIADLKLDVPSVCAGLLHDCVEDTSATIEELSTQFGQEVAFLVDGVTKLGKIPWNTREERQAENFRKMLLAMARDIRVILIKLADRLDNMRTLEHMPPDKQERIAAETMDIYAPLANRLGIQWLRSELEDWSFRYTQPDEFQQLHERLERTQQERSQYVSEVVDSIRHEMDLAGIACEVSGRSKHLYSIHQKMRKTGRELEQIFDIVAFRVKTDSVRQCYEALGVLHSKWTPIPGRFKDYIALPKPNFYQSLHTSVIGPRSERMEAQIRTRDMHRVAEEGIAAHWKYKEGGRLIDEKDEKRFAWLRQLMEWQRDLADPTEFIETVKIDLFDEEVYVFTPKGDVKALPKGATPIDFAYAVHTEVGHHCSGARVNGVIVPLRYQLRNGDTIEVLTSPQQRPNKDWLKFCSTSRAKAKIRYYIRTEQRERSRALGNELLEREFRRYDLSLVKALKGGDLQRAATALKLGTAEDLLIAVGYGKLPAHAVVQALVPEEKRKASSTTAGVGSETPPPNPMAELLQSVAKRSTTSAGITVQGENDVLVRFAKCCNPLLGDPIVGFITRGRGVTVHTMSCPKALDLDPDRRIVVEWDGRTTAPRPVAIQVVCADRTGLLAVLSQSFTDAGVNISQALCRSTEDNRAVNTFHVNVSSLEQLKTVMRNLKKVTGVYSVERLGGAA